MRAAKIFSIAVVSIASIIVAGASIVGLGILASRRSAGEQNVHPTQFLRRIFPPIASERDTPPTTLV